MNNLTLVIPAKEESDSLPIVLKELSNYNHKIIISVEKDDIQTINSIKEFNCEIIYQSKKGYGNAIIDGIKNIKTDYFCIFNADGSFDPNDLNRMLTICKNDLDFVFASRYLKNAGSDDDTFLTWFGNFIFTLLGKYFLKIDLTDILYTYVLCNKKSFLNLKIKNNDYRLCVELPFKVHFYKYKYTSIASHEYKRQFGEKNVNEFRDGFLILLEIIRCFKKRILH